MNIGHTPSVELAAGTGLSLLVTLSAAAGTEPAKEGGPVLAEALEAVGDRAGETWLNLFGVGLDAGPPYTADRLRDALSALDGVELRRHLLGRYAWSWCSVAGTDVIEAAAQGDEQAARRLRAHRRYYAGRAEESLSVLLPLGPEETKERILRAVDVGAQRVLDERSRRALERARDEAETVLRELSRLAAIERLTQGYRYVPEPEAERVLLVPHLERAPQLVLAQHRDARLIVYRARIELEAEVRLLALGRALSDPKRVEILALVARDTARVADLVAHTGLSRSTVHHHLAQLRDAGLLVLEGNARSYAFAVRPRATADAAALLADVLGDHEEEES